MQISSRSVLRWMVPLLAAAAAVGGGWTFNLLTATAQQGLKPLTAQQLLVEVHKARLAGMSGTVVENASLGLPQLPGGSSSSALSSLASGSHTLKVWFSSPRKARVALLGTLGESDVVVNGRDLWTWSSRTKTATHSTLTAPQGRSTAEPPLRGNVSATPQQAAQQMLRTMEPSTRVQTSGTASVAGRPAYELVLTPRETGSLIGQVRIAVDGTTRVPLRVQVFARGSSTPAFEVGYTSFDPTRPAPTRFDFRPPPGARVERQGRLTPDAQLSGPMIAGPRAKVVGHGWTSVVVTRAPGPAAAAPGQLPQQLTRVIGSLPPVSGSWGAGRLLRGSLFSAVLTQDGRVAVGAVPPESLYRALAAR